MDASETRGAGEARGRPGARAGVSAAAPLAGCSVVFVLPHLGPGGAQRVVTLVANQWSAQGLKVGVVTTLDDKRDAHRLDPRVIRIKLREAAALRAPAAGARGSFMHAVATMGVRLHAWLLAMDGLIDDSLVRLNNRALEHRSRLEGLGKCARSPSRGADTGTTNGEDTAHGHVPAARGQRNPGPFTGSLARARLQGAIWALNGARFMVRLPIRGYYAMRRAVRFSLQCVVRVVSACLASSLDSPLFRIRVVESLSRSLGLGDGLRRLGVVLSRLVVGKRARELRRLLQAAPPPRIVSFLTKTNVHTVLAAWELPTRVVLSERNDPDLQHLDPIWQQLRAFTYSLADVVTSNSDGVLSKMTRFCQESRLQLLPNPLVLPPAAKGQLVRQPQFVIVARLVRQKAIDVLLHAFARISAQLPEWRLAIVGDGPLREELSALARSLGIAEQVTFHGHVANPIEMLRAAAVFVLPSRFEGMPNSLLEAMATGLPPIVSDASPGPLELVHQGTTGLVVPVGDDQALALAMLRLAEDESYRHELGSAAQELVGKHDWPLVEQTWRQVLAL